jgi:hypothetical protein
MTQVLGAQPGRGVLGRSPLVRRTNGNLGPASHADSRALRFRIADDAHLKAAFNFAYPWLRFAPQNRSNTQKRRSRPATLLLRPVDRTRVFESFRKGRMNQGKLTSPTTVTNQRLNAVQSVAVPAEPKTRSRHAAITRDLYSYKRYKDWMNNLHVTWDKT